MNQHIQSKLSKLSELNVQVGLAANTITIIPDSDDKSWRIWVDPSWRIIRDNKVVMSSMECPHISQYEEEDKYREAFREWVKQIENQIKKIASIVVKPGPLDLIVTFGRWNDFREFCCRKRGLYLVLL